RDALNELQSFADESLSQRAPDFRLHGKSIQFPDARAESVPYSIRKGLSLIGAKSGALAPLRSGGRTIGFIWVARTEIGAFLDKEMALLQSFADQAVIAIDN